MDDSSHNKMIYKTTFLPRWIRAVTVDHGCNVNIKSNTQKVLSEKAKGGMTDVFIIVPVNGASLCES